jgi:hypothetical protein
MSLNLNDAAMAGNVEEVIIRLNLGEDVNQKYYPRYKFCPPALLFLTWHVHCTGCSGSFRKIYK